MSLRRELDRPLLLLRHHRDSSDPACLRPYL